MDKKRTRLLIAPAALLVSVFTVAGCNTVEGMGQDIAALGRTLTGSAQDVAQSGDDKQNQKQQAESGEQQRAAADRD